MTAYPPIPERLPNISGPLGGLKYILGEPAEDEEDHGFIVSIDEKDWARSPGDTKASVERMLHRNYDQARVEHPEWGLTGNFQMMDAGVTDFGRSMCFAWYERTKKSEVSA